jgi:hypothetical protein
MRRRCADFHRGPGQIMPYYRPDVWQQPDPPSPPSTSLALGSGPCMAVLWRVSARRERAAGRERPVESEQQCFGSPSGGRGGSGPMRMRCSVQQLKSGAVRIMCGPDPKTLCEVSGWDEDHIALCDYPVADGKTCDQRMCEVHRTRAGNTTSIIAPTIARQRREVKRSALKTTAHKGEVSCL